MNESAIYELLRSQQKQIRELKLHLEALKRMMFEHRPAFVLAFEHQLGAIEASGFLHEIDEAIRGVELQLQNSRKT